MPRRYQYAPLSPTDRQNLRRAARNKWVSFFKGIWYFVLLAFMGIVLVHLFLAYIILNPRGGGNHNTTIADVFPPDTLLYYSLLLIPYSITVIIASSIWLAFSLTPVYIDLLKGRKKLLRFSPSPYTVPGSDYYYVHIGLPGKLYLQVTYEQYMGLDYSRDCYLEVAPRTNITLGFKTIE